MSFTLPTALDPVLLDNLRENFITAHSQGSCCQRAAEERTWRSSEGFHPLKGHLKWCWAELGARPHTLYSTELSNPEITMKLSLLYVSAYAKSLGCKKQHEMEILSQGWAGSFEEEVS